jgi:hypothetical protein
VRSAAGIVVMVVGIFAVFAGIILAGGTVGMMFGATAMTNVGAPGPRTAAEGILWGGIWFVVGVGLVIGGLVAIFKGPGMFTPRKRH